MVTELESMGGRLRTGCDVQDWEDLPPARAYLFDTSPESLLRVAGPRLSRRYRRAIQRWRHGSGVFKLDLALDGPVPWRAPACAEAGTVHLGGTLEEIQASGEAVARGRLPVRPFVLVTQPSLFDPSRAPDGKHTLWAYCHVPNGCAGDMTRAIMEQIERFAPGTGQRVIGRSVRHAMALEAYNPNYVGGDINGGRQDLRQILARPVVGPAPYRTGAQGVYLCSAATPPGGGVHGMCGWHAAALALREVFELEV
jgi:phytoene dehydrogenase-like protein